MNPLLALVVALAIPLAVGAAGGLITSRSVAGWYADLRKPVWTPPARWFGPIWTVLYLAMGVASWLVWRLGPERLDVRIALWLYGLQLVVNALWAPLFFGLRRLRAALTDILLLWLLVGLTTLAFYRLSNEAAALMLPYWAWVTFAAGLNALILRLNP